MKPATRPADPAGRSSQGGFTLLEIGLALGIGIIIAASVTVFYNQTRDNAGDAAMRQRLGSLQAVVETLYSAQGQSPSLTDVQDAWKARRPEDYNKSPWGGDIAVTAASAGAVPVLGDLQSGGDVNVDLDAKGVIPYGQESRMTAGGLYYYRLTDSQGPNASATGSVWDQTRKMQVPITGYGLAGLKSANKHYMVTSGR
ncbi:MAG TPA: type II secretion system protein [Pantanalinema sp.]